MSPLLALAGLDVAGALLIAGLFAYAGRAEPAPYLRRWTIAWTLLAVSQLLAANDLLGRPVPYVNMALPLAGVGSVLFLVAGTQAFAGRRYSHLWTGAAILAGMGTGLLEQQGVDPFRAATPPVVVLSAAMLTAAYCIHRQPPRHRSQVIPAVAMTLWACNTLTYPVLGGSEEAVPIGTGLSTLFQLATGIGLLMVHLDRVGHQLRVTRERERALIDHAVVGIFRADPDGRFVLANPRLLQMLGYDDFAQLREDRPIQSVYAEPEEYERAQRESGAEAFETDSVWVRRDGVRRRVRCRAREIASADGKARYVEGFAIDVTDQHRNEEQNAVAQRLQAVGRLSSGIAHDFNNLLTVITGNLTLAMSQGETPELKDALEASTRAAQLTKQLVGFSRGHDTEADTADLVQRVDVLTRLLGRTLPERIELRVTHAENACVASVPAITIDQVLLNLVMNASDALGSTGGVIEVSTRIVEDESGSWAIVEVSDDGPELRASMVDRLFEPYASLRGERDDAGLGLSIVRELVERANGSIDVETRAHAGARFRVRFPHRAKKPVAAKPRPVLPEPRGTILVVDDEPAVLRATARLLRAEGYDVETADGVAAAVERLRPDLTAVISDVVMGDGDGFDVASEIERRGWGIPCVLVSGYPDRVLRARHMDDVPPIMLKPVDVDELLEVLNGQIEARSELKGAG